MEGGTTCREGEKKAGICLFCQLRLDRGRLLLEVVALCLCLETSLWEAGMVWRKIHCLEANSRYGMLSSSFVSPKQASYCLNILMWYINMTLFKIGTSVFFQRLLSLIMCLPCSSVEHSRCCWWFSRDRRCMMGGSAAPGWSRASQHSQSPYPSGVLLADGVNILSLVLLPPFLPKLKLHWN